MSNLRWRLVTVGVIAAFALAGAGCVGRSPSAAAPQTGQSLTLARDPWPCSGHDAQRTHRSSAIGPSAPTTKWVANGFFEEPVIGPSGVLLMDDEHGSLVGLDSVTGRVAWQPGYNPNLEYWHGIPALLSDGRMIVTGVGGSGLGTSTYVAAVDAQGRTLWRTPLGATNYGLTEPGDLTIGDPTIGPDGTIYVVAAPPNALYALDPNDGSVRWTRAGGESYSRDAVVSASGNVYVPGFASGQAVAFGHDGSRLWGVKIGAEPYSSSVATDGTLYVLDATSLHAIAPDGSQRWTVPSEAHGDIAIGTDGTLYMIGDGLYATSSDGQALWHAKVGSLATLLVDGADTIYVQNDAGWLYAVNRDGSIKWRRKLGALTSTAPVMGSDGTLYCVDGMGDTGGLVAVGDELTK